MANRGGACRFGYRDGEEADRAASGDGNCFRYDFSGEDGVNGIAEWIEDRGIFGRNGRVELPNI